MKKRILLMIAVAVIVVTFGVTGVEKGKEAFVKPISTATHMLGTGCWWCAWLPCMGFC